MFEPHRKPIHTETAALPRLENHGSESPRPLRAWPSPPPPRRPEYELPVVAAESIFDDDLLYRSRAETLFQKEPSFSSATALRRREPGSCCPAWRLRSLSSPSGTYSANRSTARARQHRLLKYAGARSTALRHGCTIRIRMKRLRPRCRWPKTMALNPCFAPRRFAYPGDSCKRSVSWLAQPLLHRYLRRHRRSTSKTHPQARSSPQQPPVRIPESLKTPVQSATMRTVAARITPSLLAALEPVALSEDLSRRLLLQKVLPSYPEQSGQGTVAGSSRAAGMDRPGRHHSGPEAGSRLLASRPGGVSAPSSNGATSLTWSTAARSKPRPS